jgi:hypothetical protein
LIDPIGASDLAASFNIYPTFLRAGMVHFQMPRAASDFDY